MPNTPQNDLLPENNEFERLSILSEVCDLARHPGFSHLCGFIENYVRKSEVNAHNSQSADPNVSHNLLRIWQTRSKMAIAFMDYIQSCQAEKERLGEEVQPEAEFLQ